MGVGHSAMIVVGWFMLVKVLQRVHVVVVNPDVRAFRLFVFRLTVEASASIIKELLYYIPDECHS